MSFICIIPARKNSKRIKNKNLIKINKKSLISITIKEAIKSKYIKNKNIFVSTDSLKIKKEAIVHGANVPFLRPKILSKDETNMSKVLNHFVEKIKKYINFKYIILLQPTSPLRKAKHIDEACKLFLKNKSKVKKLVSVIKLPNNFFPFKIMEKNKLAVRQLKGYTNYNSKKSNFYLRNGPAIFIYKKMKLKDNIYEGNLLKYIMEEKYSLDLNYRSDLKKIQRK